MSNATQHSRQSGDSRRRRSRGGKKRSQNQNQDRRGGDRGSRGQQAARAEEFRPMGPRPPRGAPPVKLTWWQKLLKAVGLYKAPAPPARQERKPEEARPREEARPPKSNTRNARGSGGGGETRARGEEPRSRGGDRSTVESSRVYVGNLSYDVTEQDLQELFKGIGGVRNVEIVYNRSTHRSKGYGFVEMLHKDDAIRAVEVLHDQPFMGRKLTVSGAKSKGQDERDEADERPQREARPVVVAPIPAAAQSADEPAITTIVENVAENSAPAEATAREDLPKSETV